MDKYNIYFKKFQLAIVIAVVAVLGCIFMIIKTVPEVQKILQIQNDYKTQSASLADSERKLADLKAEAAKRSAEDENVLQMFFKPLNEGLDTEAAISDEFGEILQLLRDNKIKTRSVKYDYDPQDDNFVKFAAHKFHVCKVSAEMVASYSNFANFLRELYKHEHFLDISKIEIVPYEKNKRVLLISLQIKLYAQRDPSSVVETPAPASADGAQPAAGGAAPTVPSPAPVNNGGTSPEAAQ